MIVTTELVRYDTAKKALMEAKNFDEVKEIHDRAAALEAYARQAKDTEMIQWATEIKIRAERKAGEMLRNAKAAGTVATPGKQTVNLKHQRWSNETTTDNTPKPATLSEIGITKDESSRFQKLAAIPDEHFETAVESAKLAAGEVSAAAVLRGETQMKQQKHKRPEKPDLLTRMFSDAHRFSTIAISQLTRIEKEDPQRVTALLEVRDYVDEQLRGD